jgi:chromate transporter
MHRLAVDVQRWMNDKQIASVFAISQIAAGAECADRDPDRPFCRRRDRRTGCNPGDAGPTVVLAHYVSRLITQSSRSRRPAIIPLSIGLMGAGGLILVLAADRIRGGALPSPRRWPLPRG